MTLFDWLWLRKPTNTSFFVKRNFESKLNVDLVEVEMKVMARLILDAVKYHTDNNFVSDPIHDVTIQMNNVYLFDYEGYQFGLATNGQEMSVGAMFHMLGSEND